MSYNDALLHWMYHYVNYVLLDFVTLRERTEFRKQT
jgi:hypothetical protein